VQGLQSFSSFVYAGQATSGAGGGSQGLKISQIISSGSGSSQVLKMSPQGISSGSAEPHSKQFPKISEFRQIYYVSSSPATGPHSKQTPKIFS
jgi:hypothetical protein